MLRNHGLKTLKTALTLLAAVYLSGIMISEVSLSDDEGAARLSDAAEAADTTELYTPPEGRHAKTISAWVEKVSRTPSPDVTPAGLREHFGKLEQAADALIARDIEEAGLIDAIRLKVGANSLLTQLGDTTAAERKQQFIAKLKQDERPAIAVHGRLLEVESAVGQLQPDDNAAARKLTDQVVTLLKEQPLTDAHVSVAYAVAEAIEMNADENVATAAYNVFAKYLKSSSDENHQSIAAMFEGSARRLNLIGNPVTIQGKTLEGESFSLEQYKGKVILIDFWATWCDPCIQEMPNIKDLYDKHHEAGFEVVGVNLDDNVGRVGTFVKLQELVWPQLVSDNGGEHPLANYYGVYQLPTTFIVGRDGKVSAIDLYGEDLAEEVERLLKEGA